MQLLEVGEELRGNRLDVLSGVVADPTILDVVLDLVEPVNGHRTHDVDQFEPHRNERVLIVAVLVELSFELFVH